MDQRLGFPFGNALLDNLQLSDEQRQLLRLLGLGGPSDQQNALVETLQGILTRVGQPAVPPPVTPQPQPDLSRLIPLLQILAAAQANQQASSNTQLQQQSIAQNQQPSFLQNQQPNFTQDQQPSFAQNLLPALAQSLLASVTQNPQASFTQDQQPSFIQNHQLPSVTLNQQPTCTQSQEPSNTQSPEPSYTQSQEPSYTQQQQPVLPNPPNAVQDRESLFPYILHGLLEDLQKVGLSSVISWTSDGKSFAVHQESVFENSLLGVYFGQNSMQEFRATLAKWGFLEDNTGFHHPCFQKDRPELRVFMSKLEQSVESRSHQSTSGPETLNRPDKDGSRARRQSCDADENNRSRRRSPDSNEHEHQPVADSSKTKGPERFLSQLRAVLDAAETGCLRHVISWKPSGRAFQVHDREAFADKVLSRIIEASDYSDFRKALRRFGFSKVRRGADEGAYYHRRFTRDDPSQCRGLTPRQMREAKDEEVEKKDIPRQIKHREVQQAGATVSSGESKKRPAPVKTSKQAKKPKVVQAADDSPPIRQDASSKSSVAIHINEAHDQADARGLLFPWQLHRLLDHMDARSEDQNKPVSWQPDGASFVVRDIDFFVKNLLGKYFEEKTWNDFINTLSKWGFVCFTSGPQKGAFIHRLLVRGKPSLCRQMRFMGKMVSDMLKNQGAFLVRLHETLGILAEEGNDSVVSWDDDGKSFTVNDRVQFLNSVFSSYFDTLTFTAFEQKLRSWGFRRMPIYYSGSGPVSYSHPGFVRDSKPQITRIKPRPLANSIRVEHGFLVRLRVMLDDSGRNGHQTVVSWLPHGKAFMVHDRPYFSNHIMPQYFKAKFSSFRQALRNHGFAQMGGNGWDEGAYYHKLFVRDDPRLCQGMTQQQMKVAMPEWIPASEEPNFYITSAPKKPERESSSSESSRVGIDSTKPEVTVDETASGTSAQRFHDPREDDSSSSSSQVTCLEYLYASKTYNNDQESSSSSSHSS